ncbi:MAG: hypothetical protein K2M30_02015 [Desulfovibrionaceae bacterium]|nr:hypothetical protein [Desulfovibrionaceae bacterium]
MNIPSIQSATSTSQITTQRNAKEQNTFASVLKENSVVPLSPEQKENISPLMQSAFVTSVEFPTNEQAHTPLDAMEIILDIMQEYISELTNMQEPKSLPELHNSLKRVEQELEDFHSTYTIQESDPLYNILTSLDILVLQERYRFNRGTYII